MNPYVAWLKSNIPIVVLVVVMLAAAIVLPILASGMNKGVRDEVQKRAANDGALTRILTAKLDVSQPGMPAISGPGPVNPKTLELLTEYEKRLSGDASSVRDLILSRNRNDRKLLVPALFPNPPGDWRDSLQFQMWRSLSDAYDALLREIDAGQPTSANDLQAELSRADEMFRTEKLAKSANADLTPDEERELRETLRTTRMTKYMERAQQIGMYASRSAIFAPYWDERSPVDLGQWFDWEWQLWIKQDVLRALRHANEGYESLVAAPVKRVRVLSVEPLGIDKRDSGGGGTGGSGMSSPFGQPQPPTPPPADAQAPAAPPAPPDARLEAQRDFNASFTGRVSNALYDVRRVNLQLVVDSARIPQVLDAIARQNLMTVIDLKMRPTDTYADLEQGYIYGTDTTADLDLTIETIWLREWTAPLMPAAIKTALTPPVG